MAFIDLTGKGIGVQAPIEQNNNRRPRTKWHMRRKRLST